MYVYICIITLLIFLMTTFKNDTGFPCTFNKIILKISLIKNRNIKLKSSPFMFIYLQQRKFCETINKRRNIVQRII